MKDNSNSEYSKKKGSIKNQNLVGTLLVASSRLKDTQFQKSVVLISNYTEKEGLIGILINKPLLCKLEQVDTKFHNTPLGHIELYHGGPVETSQMILTAWQWEPNIRTFKLHFGISYEKACHMLQAEPHLIIRGFLGYAVWTWEKIQEEIKQKLWINALIDEIAIQGYLKEKLWEKYQENSTDNSLNETTIPYSSKDPSLN